MAKPIAKPAAKKKAKTSTFKLRDPDQIYAQLKICLARITGFKVSEIFSTDSLADKYHFTPGGQRVLALNLESCFANAGHPIPKPIDRDALEKAKTVGDVADAVNTAFGI